MKEKEFYGDVKELKVFDLKSKVLTTLGPVVSQKMSSSSFDLISDISIN